MLDLAIKHKEELQEKFRNTWFDEKYKYWACGNYYEESEIAESTWSYHQFVSLDSSGKVIGYISYHIDRGNDFVDGLNIINFSDNAAVFGLDAGRAIRDIFEKFHFRKLNFVVVIGNPIESTYDKMVSRYGGRIVGTQRKNIKLIDGKYYDEKLYEVLAEDYCCKSRRDEVESVKKGTAA